MLGWFRKTAKPSTQILAAWESLCEKSQEAYAHVLSEIEADAEEPGAQILADIDRTRLFIFICHAGLIGFLMPLKSPAEGKRYLPAFAKYLVGFVERRLPELLSGSELAKLFISASQDDLPRITAQSRVWTDDRDGPFVFDQAVSAYLIRESARAKYLLELPGVGRYMPPLPVSMFKVQGHMMELGCLLSSERLPR